MEKDTQVWQRRAAMLFCLLSCGLLLLPLIRFFFPVLLPFVFSWGVVHAVLPLSRRLSQAMGIPQRVCAVLLLLLLIALLVGALGLLVWRGLLELKEMVGEILAQLGAGDDFFGAPLAHLAAMLERLGIDTLEGQTPRGWFREMAEAVLSRLADILPGIIGKLLSVLPSALFSLFVTVIAGFYFCMDPKMPLGYLPAHWQRAIHARTGRLLSLLGRFGKAYLCLWLMTFGELWVGFLILGVKRAWFIALLASLVDILPVLGVGTVLIPWSILALLGKDFFLGIGLLILFLAVSAVRQVMEPRLVGKTIGMSPLLALFAGYAGLYWFGVVGAILAPFALLLLRLPVNMVWQMIQKKTGTELR